MTQLDSPRPRPRVGQPTIAATFASALLDLAVSKGAAREELLNRSGLDPQLLLDRDARVPLDQWVALMRQSVHATGDPALALHFGEAFDMAEMSVIGLMGRAVETKAEGFEMLNRFSRLVADVETPDGERFKLVEDHDGVWLVDTRLNPNDTPEVSEASFAQITAMARMMLPGAQHFTAVHFTHPQPVHRAEYDRVFGMPVVFSSDRNGLLMPHGWESERIALQPRYALEILSAHADALLEQLDSTVSTRSRVEKAIAALLPDGGASETAVADALRLTPQTLYRRLKAEGVTFAQVLSSVRCKLAKHYLRDKGRSAKETGFLLGFSDPAAFSRAFKRWTGLSPAQFLRKKNAPEESLLIHRR